MSKEINNLNKPLKDQLDLDNKQDQLISGENIKTINGQNILGSGNLRIAAGAGGASNNNGNSYIHFSFDDVTTVINALAAGTLNSIYDNAFIAMLKSMHDNYGFVFSLYIQNAPSNISTKHQAELREASSWLKWGLHSLNGSNYQTSTYEQGKNDWNKMVDVILKLTGTHNAIDRMPRLHQFYGSEAALQGMRDAKLGAKGFLSADDTRDAYYLSADKLNYLYAGENDHLTDFKNSLVFYRTDLRLDWFSDAGFTYNAEAGASKHEPANKSDIAGELQLRFNDALYINTWDCYVIFTHEWQPIAAIQNALNAIGTFANNHNIPFDFPQNNHAHICQGDIHSVTAAADPEPEEPEEPEEPLGTYIIGSRTLNIVNNFTSMEFEIGKTLVGGYALGDDNFKDSTGRAASCATILKVNEGESITLNQVIDGITLAYSLRVFKDTNGNTASDDDKFVANSWLSENVTLPAEAQYILVGFKRGDGSSDFTSAEVALLPNALTIS